MGLFALLVAFVRFFLPILAVQDGSSVNGWTRSVPADAHELLRLHLVMRSHRFEELEQHAIDLATPGHRHYGKHLSNSELQQFMQPSSEVLTRVLDWLDSADIQSIDIKGPRIVLNASVAQLEHLLDNKFYHYASSDGRDIVRTPEYNTPPYLTNDIEMIQPTTRFPSLRPLRSLILPQYSPYLEDPEHSKVVLTSLSSTREPCTDIITPACLRALYGLENPTIPDISAASLGIAGFLNQYARWSDWRSFVELCAPWADGKNYSANGPNPQDDPSDNREASLDIQYALSLAPNIRTVFISTPGLGPLVPDGDQPTAENNTNEPWLDHLNGLVGREDYELPSVMSYSYGENEQALPRDYAFEVCKLFLQLGTRGVSILVASGDDGPGGSCTTNDGNEQARFLPTFPASCPWVTAVGGTTGVLPERAASFSGGGFSEYFYGQDYAKPAVDGYLKKFGSAFDGLYQREGRAYPDVSAQAHAFRIVAKGHETVVSGTSAATPVWAALIANLISIRYRQGMRRYRIGFLNIWLYSLDTGFTDIVDGGSQGCFGYDMESGHNTTHIPDAGWNATEGWDLATGLGTPVFGELVDAMPIFTDDR